MQARPLESQKSFIVIREWVWVPLHLAPIRLAPLHRCQELMKTMVVRYGEAKSRRGRISSLCGKAA